MKAWRRGAAALLAAAAVTGMVPVVASAAETGGRVVKAWFSNDIYLVPSTDVGWNDPYKQPRRLSYEEWAALGSPTPEVLEAHYAALPHSTTVYGYVFEPNPYDAQLTWDDVLQVEALSFAQWDSVGRPQPVVDLTFCEAAYCHLHKWASGDQVFLQEQRNSSAGFRQISYGEWAQLGFQAVVNQGVGFYKMPFSDTIFTLEAKYLDPATPVPAGYFFGCNGQSYEWWRYYGFPPPQVLTRPTAADRYTRVATRSDIWYSGPAGAQKLTLAGWQSVGSPAPIVDGGTITSNCSQTSPPSS
ncbi:hypothetical protein L1785_05290 [Antribacter sp. KLBMP9083]|uniref:Uncharacterized protein n=1 Tax=Antribacter soli TaxID=2910976 RepID=A0AA41QE01_9MICO|nr:hypothetical protein [Antribacter soli]MCF4120387.1 hypothetical protein [Antribacter soli]